MSRWFTIGAVPRREARSCAVCTAQLLPPSSSPSVENNAASAQQQGPKPSQFWRWWSARWAFPARCPWHGSCFDTGRSVRGSRRPYPVSGGPYRSWPGSTVLPPVHFVPQVGHSMHHSSLADDSIVRPTFPPSDGHRALTSSSFWKIPSCTFRKSSRSVCSCSRAYARWPTSSLRGHLQWIRPSPEGPGLRRRRSWD